MLSPTTQPFGSLPTANLSTTWTINESYAQPVLLRETSVAQFTCGFFCVASCFYFNGTYLGSYIFAVFISGNKFSSKSEVIWSANQDDPVSMDAILHFSAAGELVLKDVDGSIVWVTNTTGKSVAGMNLTDTGNLVLFDDQNSVVWQSFDQPTDSLLPGQKLFQGQELRSRGMIRRMVNSLQLTDKGVFGFINETQPQSYYRWLVYHKDTNIGRRYMRFLNGSLSFFTESSEPEDYVSEDYHLSVLQA